MVTTIRNMVENEAKQYLNVYFQCDLVYKLSLQQLTKNYLSALKICSLIETDE
jgi:hypothetical protein